MNLQEVKQFVTHFITGEYDPEEYAAFLQWLKGATADELNAIADEHEALHERWSLPSVVPSPEWVMQLEKKLDEADGAKYEAPVTWIYPNRFKRKTVWVAAASVAVLLTTGALVFNKYGTRSGSAGKQPTTTEALTNIFSVPKGGEQKQIVLADGSKVLLNAASTLTYPSSFAGKERIVQLSGEAFFDVSKNSGMPFRVMIKDAEVDVLGTRFNVKAYNDEAFSRTTLLEGSVKIKNASKEETLNPGQQAEVPYTSPGVAAPIRVTNPENPDAALAWRNGYLVFRNDDLQTVMRTIGRCYNVEIQYGPNIRPHTFTGSFAIKPGLAKIVSDLKQIESLKQLQIDITYDGKTVTVVH